MTTGKSDGEQKSSLDESKSYNPAGKLKKHRPSFTHLIIYIGRVGRDSDMAASVLFLAGPGGTFYNEQIICPDGGNTLVQPAVK